MKPCRTLARVVPLPFAFMLVLHAGCGGTPPTGTPPVTIAPEPLPSSTPDVGGGPSASCALGKGEVDAVCSQPGGAPRLLRYVEAAIDHVVGAQPQFFDLGSEAVANTGTYRVLNAERFIDAVVARIGHLGVCAERDTDDVGMRRILVKDTNDFSEGFSIVSDRGFIQRGHRAHVQACTPASFPVDRVGDVPPIGSGCGRPYPPPVTRFNVKVHMGGIAHYTVDSTAIVGPNSAYCLSVGFTDGRSLCPVRPEGHPERHACETWRVGRARDTGRPGPTWTNGDGVACTGPESNCENHPDNQYNVLVFKSGKVTACSEAGACGWTTVER